MRKKPIMMMTTMLIILLVLPSIAQATVVHYWWDNVYFVEGTDIDYAHPDNVYYDISKTSDWTIQGRNLYHYQLNKDSTFQLVVGALALSAAFGLAVAAWLGGGTMATVVGGLAGIALASFVEVVIDYYFVDERGCIWWWIGSIFMAYLVQNLPYLSGVTKEVALATIIAAFVCYGYLRVGKVTFYDPISKGAPGPPCSLTISATIWGGTIPYTGTYSCEHDTRATVYAIPWEDCLFNYWSLDGTIKYGNPITVTMDTSHSLKAYFYHDPNTPGGDGCPTLLVWNGNAYVDYGVINIHNPTGEDVIREVPILKEDVCVNNYKAKFRLREGWEGLNFSESVIDQVKLYAVDNYGNRYLCPLISAKHSRLGNVLPQLLFSDEWKVQTLLLETVDLTFIVPCQNIQSFTFTIEGCNRFKL